MSRPTSQQCSSQRFSLSAASLPCYRNSLVLTAIDKLILAWTAYLTECMAQQAAGAFALGNMLRNPGAAVAAVIIPSLVSRMGSGWCFTGRLW